MGETTSILEKVVLVYGSLMSLIALGIMLAIIAPPPAPPAGNCSAG